MVERVLVTGGGGYVGSSICMAWAEVRFERVCYDNFLNGHRAVVKWGPLEEGDIRDTERLTQVLREYKPVAVVHCAAFIEVGESVKDPVRFFENNVAGSISVLNAMKSA